MVTGDAEGSVSCVTESSKVASVRLRVTCAAVHTRLVNGLRALERPAVTLEPLPCCAGGQLARRDRSLHCFF